jgi:hypothetical protein
MKKLLFTIITVALSFAAFAQKYIPTIKEGSALTYDVYSKGLGQHITLTLTVKKLDTGYVKLQWSVEGYGSGLFEIPAKAFENSSKLVVKQPDPDGTTTLNDDETTAIISKATFKSLVNDKAFQLNGQKYTVVTDTTTYKINDRPVDLFHATTESGKNEIWVLNISYFPLVYHAKSVTRGIDVTLTGIKE